MTLGFDFTTYFMVAFLVCIKLLKIELQNNFKMLQINMCKILFLINLFIVSSVYGLFTKNIIQLDVGNYTLTPANYSYNPQIIIEMWGGGGAGNLCNGYGGNSGGYLKFILDTNYQNIEISVGSGGIGTKNYNYKVDGALCIQPKSYKNYNVHYPDSGSDSILNMKDIRIIASGGKWNTSLPMNSVNYVPPSVKVIQNINSQSGKLFGNNILPLMYCGEEWCCRWDSPGISLTAFSGGFSYGGAGGNPWSASSTKLISNPTSGETPSGGGGGQGLLPDYVKPNGESSGGHIPCLFSLGSTPTNGGNGRVIIYLNKII
jgi:hypothetical protein